MRLLLVEDDARIPRFLLSSIANVCWLEKKNTAVLAAVTAGEAEVHIYGHAPDVVGGKLKIYMDGAELVRIQGNRYDISVVRYEISGHDRAWTREQPRLTVPMSAHSNAQEIVETIDLWLAYQNQ